jgi:hypothetical protein
MRSPRENPVVARDVETAIRNERLFREANERIAERRDELDVVDAPTPFLCECEDEACTAIVRLGAEDYRRIREQPYTFVIVPGHPTIGFPTELAGDGWQCVSKEGKV